MTLRHYFISDDLDDLELLEDQLEHHGVEKPQIHVLSNDAEGVENHLHLHAVQSLLKNDVIHSGLIGAFAGVFAASVMLVCVHFFELNESPAGWLPFYFLSVLIVCFCTWEGGFIGFQNPNYHYSRFEQSLAEGNHVFIVDLDPEQEPVLKKLLESHSKLKDMGTEMGAPHWIFALQHVLYAFIERNLFSSSQVHHREMRQKEIDSSDVSE
jgi:hypothetical protein